MYVLRIVLNIKMQSGIMVLFKYRLKQGQPVYRLSANCLFSVKPIIQLPSRSDPPIRKF